MQESECPPADALMLKNGIPRAPTVSQTATTLMLMGLGVLQQPSFFDRGVISSPRAGALELPDRPVILPLVAFVELFDAQRRTGFEQTVFGNQAGKTPSGVGAAAEAEDEDVVAWTVIVDQPLVGLGDIVIDPLPNIPPMKPFTPVS